MRLSGDLSRPEPWSLWVTQARHYAASMAEIKHHNPLPRDDHHFSALKAAKCQGVPLEVFGFLGAPKVKLNPLSAPFLPPSTNLIEKDFRYRQRASRLLLPLLMTRHLGGALARVIKATDDVSKRNVLCSIRRIMLGNSLTYLGEARSGLMEAV